MQLNRFRPSTALAAAAMALLTACTTDNASSPLGNSAPEVSAAVLAGTPNVIVSNIPANAGSFASFTANNSGRVATEFWDNRSADVNGVEKCNIGWYASGAIAPSCLNDDGTAAGSDANSVAGVYTRYLADGPQNRDATSFMFSGNTTYDVTLKGSYAGSNSTVGWYTKSGSTYTFHPVPAWSTQNVNTTVAVNPMGQQWGLYISNEFNPQPGGCAAQTFCSDAEGGFSGMPFNQFALFSNRAGTAFLVGSEDNKLEILDNTPLYDSDYNDYIFAVVPRTVCDYVTFGHVESEDEDGRKVEVHGNAGGKGDGDSYRGGFKVKAGGMEYNVREIETYGPVLAGALSARANARMVSGHATNGAYVEVRLWDGGDRNSDRDEVYVRIDGKEHLGSIGKKGHRGKMHYHNSCRDKDTDDEDDDRGDDDRRRERDDDR